MLSNNWQNSLYFLGLFTNAFAPSKEAGLFSNKSENKSFKLNACSKLSSKEALISCLVTLIDQAELQVIRRANAIASSNNFSLGTTRDTIPTSYARWALIGSPVKAISKAMARGS